jgi:hypothetical protein
MTTGADGLSKKFELTASHPVWCDCRLCQECWAEFELPEVAAARIVESVSNKHARKLREELKTFLKKKP